MPHITVKVATGKSELQKTHLAGAIVRDVMDILHAGEVDISVAIEEVEPADWTEKVYKPDIQGKWKTLYKKPGYDPLKK
jgi:4-oxalocrotonate tautomerase